MKKKSVLSVLLISCILCLSGCDGISLNKKVEEEPEDKRITVKVDTPKISSISIEGDFIGSIESEEQVHVVSRLSGDVTDTFFEVGDYVNEGDLLFTIDDTSAQIQYKQAKAALSSANASLNTAQAGVNTANASVNATAASVNEKFSTAKTTDQQLQLQIDSADVNFRNAQMSIGLIDDNIADINEDINELNDKLDDLNDIRKSLEKQLEAATDPVVQGKLATQLNSTRSGIDELESVKESLESSKKQLQVQSNSAKNSNCLVLEQGDLARSQKSDYDNYTKATIGNAGLLSIAQAEAGVVQAQAGVTQSKAGITQAQANVEAAELQLDYANVTAPVSGVITSKGVTKNNMTSPGAVAYTIMSDGTKYVSFFVSENVMKELVEGQTISVDKNGDVYGAVITENPGVIDQQSGLFKVKARVNSTDDMANGVKVKLTMMTQHSDNVLTLPIDAVYHESEKSYVYTYGNGKANKVYVETGLFNDELIEIISGISEADQVITTWSSQLRNGVEVKVDNAVSTNATQSKDILIERN